MNNDVFERVLKYSVNIKVLLFSLFSALFIYTTTWGTELSFTPALNLSSVIFVLNFIAFFIFRRSWLKHQSFIKSLDNTRDDGLVASRNIMVAAFTFIALSGLIVVEERLVFGLFMLNIGLYFSNLFNLFVARANIYATVIEPIVFFTFCLYELSLITPTSILNLSSNLFLQSIIIFCYCLNLSSFKNLASKTFVDLDFSDLLGFLLLSFSAIILGISQMVLLFKDSIIAMEIIAANFSLVSLLIFGTLMQILKSADDSGSKIYFLAKSFTLSSVIVSLGASIFYILSV